ncbi:hypothetical protein JK636_00870 [Clostridium sp. YIM B02515]|uniref:Amidase n=1 Tax=Clostridium rhizosphaerae TaxID=2803861 RepID=A0ABS1T4P2_9CLOT|nr:amidase family protein [Clostridium rhizosphaerae]MBL4934303.1 hypothetical protein [Clostridium rhizosphaerae]
MKEDVLEQYLKIAKGTLKARELLGKTVVSINEDLLIQEAESLKIKDRLITVGVKNTKQIDRLYVKRLIDTEDFIWHTIDGMSDGGRAIDINLINPITGRVMTGSSSASAINVLYGINDLGIGTDGGGSVLAPALSLNLFSIMAKGLGLKGSDEKVSTDNISFVPGIGVISHSFKIAKKSILSMLNIEDKLEINKQIKIAVCTRKNTILPTKEDMREKLAPIIRKIESLGIEINEENFPDFENREEAIKRVKELYKNYSMLITYEGPVDLLGTGDSVFGMLGSFAKSLQNQSGKYMVKIANMVNATAITIPSDEVSSGVVICARDGIEDGLSALKLAEQLKDIYEMPVLYKNYFEESYRRRKDNIIFSLRGV